MCGIVGYIGDKQAAPILLDGLSKLEEDYIIRNITDARKPEQLLYNTCRQLSFFDREEDGIERRYAL